jgi:hypothetical protein
MASLNQEKTDFVKTTHESTFSSVVLQLRSGVELVFFLEEKPQEPISEYDERCKSEDPNRFRLASFSLMRK